MTTVAWFVFTDRSKDCSRHSCVPVCVRDFLFLLALSSRLSARFFHLQLSALYLMTHHSIMCLHFPPTSPWFSPQLILSDGKLHETGENCSDLSFFLFSIQSWSNRMNNRFCSLILFIYLLLCLVFNLAANSVRCHLVLFTLSTVLFFSAPELLWLAPDIHFKNIAWQLFEICQWQFSHLFGRILFNNNMLNTIWQCHCALTDTIHISNEQKVIKASMHHKTPLADHKPKATAAPGSRWLRGDVSDSNQCVWLDLSGRVTWFRRLPVSFPEV